MVDMPVFFFVDPDFASDPRMDGVSEIILSYTFYRTEEPDIEEGSVLAEKEGLKEKSSQIRCYGKCDGKCDSKCDGKVDGEVDGEVDDKCDGKGDLFSPFIDIQQKQHHIQDYLPLLPTKHSLSSPVLTALGE